MNLHEALKQLPADMKLLNHASIRRDIRTVSEWLKAVKDETGYAIGESRYNYGKVVRKTLYVPGIGTVFSEIE